MKVFTKFTDNPFYGCRDVSLKTTNVSLVVVLIHCLESLNICRKCHCNPSNSMVREISVWTGPVNQRTRFLERLSLQPRCCDLMWSNQASGKITLHQNHPSLCNNKDLISVVKNEAKLLDFNTVNYLEQFPLHIK